MSMSGLVTVLIPARNEEDFIGPCLRSVLAQSYRDLDVVVVDGASSDTTRDIVGAFAAADQRVRCVDNPEQIIPRALNVGLAHARGKWLVRVDAHSTIPPDYVSRVVEHLSTGRWGAVGGRKDGVGLTPAGSAIAAALGSRLGVGSSTYHYGEHTQEVDHVPFGSYPVELLRSMGGWNEDLLAREDIEFDHRLTQAGHKILFDPNIVIHWGSRQRIFEQFTQYFRYGRFEPRVAYLHPRSMKFRHLVAPALVVWTIAMAGLTPLFPWAIAGLLPYAAAVLAVSGSTARRLPTRRARTLLPIAFAAIHYGWGLGFWAGIVDVVRSRPRAIRSQIVVDDVASTEAA